MIRLRRLVFFFISFCFIVERFAIIRLKASFLFFLFLCLLFASLFFCFVYRFYRFIIFTVLLNIDGSCSFFFLLIFFKRLKIVPFFYIKETRELREIQQSF